ncbi:hypothetical protein N7517_009180 [Penicillium concentricum]|uniref:Ankyrin repeat-containing domain protein n=1 Tax=Penicillium concentricum TaxID=293559 RepID=A0A9W9RJG8_9EURO|nr:uncharacterized protein N7517_009180 [Penicillium concentricum]KAJ5359989.1 hypothetical protein N7517_009180 [Penicillium concentricum]
MSQLASLPTDLLLIAESLPNQQDLSAFVQTIQRTYIVLQLYLYKNNIKYHGSSALLWAAEHGDTTLTKKMLDAGTSIRAFDPFSANPIPLPHRVDNPLSLASRGQRIETLTCLLAETRPGQKWVPGQLRATLQEGAIPARSVEAVKLLLRYNVPIAPTEYIIGFQSAIGAAVTASWADILPFLLEGGACMDENEIPTALENAVRMKQPEVVEILLGAGVRLEDDEMICTVVLQGSLRMLEAFVEAGFEVERCWQRALFVAVVHGKTEMVAWLIEKGSNPHLRTDMLMINRDNLRYSTIGFAVHFEGETGYVTRI